MKIAVMQPYFLPYLGYYQLVNAVDTFVFFDDVNFIKKGWIHRNQILVNGEAYKFTIPLKDASQNKKINEVQLSDFAGWRASFLKVVEHNYKKAPYYESVRTLLENLLSGKEYETISELASESVKAVAEYLGIGTRFLYSSSLDYDRSEAAGGQEKIVSICKLLGADTYINPQNGVELYEEETFTDAGIGLRFIHMGGIRYEQLKKDTFVPYLSMLDVLMFNDINKSRALLDTYELKQKVYNEA